MKKKYRLLYGKFYGHTDKGLVKFGEGDIIELTDKQAISFKDMFEPIDGSKQILTKEKDDKLRVIHKGFGKYDVIVGRTGKPINDQQLTKKEAYSLLESGGREPDERQKEDRGDTEKEQAENETEAAKDTKVDTPKVVAKPGRIPPRRRAKPEPSQSKTYSRKKIDSGK